MPANVMDFIDLAAQRRRLGDRIDRAIARVLDHGRFVLGPEVETLEQRLEAFCGARHCITCANGTDALELALSALGIGRGDAVIVPAFSYVATVEVVVSAGATPIFADVDRTSFNIVPASVEAAIAVAKGMGLVPRCLMTVDLFGQPADYAALRAIATAEGITLIADAAQSFGARSPWGRVGALADITTTSFYPAKPLGCYGDGGAIFTDDARLAEVMRSLRNHGHAAQGGAFVRVGRNSRLDTIQAAILLEKLAVFDDEIAARNAAADRYAARLPASITPPVIEAGKQSVWAQYTVKVASGRDALVAAVRAAGVPIAIHYMTPLHLVPPYSGFPRATARLEGAEYLSGAVFSLPMHADLDAETQDRVVGALERATTATTVVPRRA
ncbi:MAG: DegT/DnrJ/EryC1/StrS family aminotransferase [Labrys sp. (in: a-proteobacteria)]